MSAPTTPAVHPARRRNAVLSLVTRLFVEKWQDGRPANVAEETVAADAAAAADCTCELCGKHGLGFKPMHHGARYVGIRYCRRCGNQQEA